MSEEIRKTRQMRSMPCQFRASEDADKKVIEGHFAVFGSNYELWPGATESIDSHAFDNTLGGDIRALINHETRLVLGRTKAGTLSLDVDNLGLHGVIEINPDDQEAMNLYSRVKRGDVSQCSFGFDIISEETQVNGDKVHWTIKEVKLYEVSCVTFPAYEETAIAARKSDYDQIQKRKHDLWKTTMKERMKK